MSKIVTSYDMFISSPSDVREEIEVIRKTVDKFNRTHRDSGTRILTVRWDSDVFFTSGKPLQSCIDDTVAACDFLVAVFRTHIGTEIDGYPSGSAKEILTTLERGKQVFVYLQKCETPPDTFDRSYCQLLNFIEELHKRNVLVTQYSNYSQLESLFFDQLNLYYRTYLSGKETASLVAREVKNHGITHIYVGNAPGDVLREKISTAKCLKILSTTARALLSSYSADIAKMLRNHGELKLLLPNPYSAFLEDVQQIEGRDSATESIHSEFAATMGYLRRSLRLAEEKGTIYVGCAYTLLRQTETICIDADGRIWSWTTMTMPPLKAAGESLSFGSQTVQQNDSETLAYQANAYFDQLWRFAESRKDIITFNNDRFRTYFYKEQ